MSWQSSDLQGIERKWAACRRAWLGVYRNFPAGKQRSAMVGFFAAWGVGGLQDERDGAAGMSIDWPMRREAGEIRVAHKASTKELRSQGYMAPDLRAFAAGFDLGRSVRNGVRRLPRPGDGLA